VFVLTDSGRSVENAWRRSGPDSHTCACHRQQLEFNMLCKLKHRLCILFGDTSYHNNTTRMLVEAGSAPSCVRINGADIHYATLSKPRTRRKTNEPRLQAVLLLDMFFAHDRCFYCAMSRTLCTLVVVVVILFHLSTTSHTRAC